jgi:hypothetical protein
LVEFDGVDSGEISGVDISDDEVRVLVRVGVANNSFVCVSVGLAVMERLSTRVDPSAAHCG